MQTSLILTRPLIIFDLETTGNDIAKDQIVELSALKIFPDGKSEIKTKRFKPSIPIPPEATAVHGITNQDVENENPFSSYAKAIKEYLINCDVAGYNSINFDVPILVEEFFRSGVDLPFNENTRFLDAMRIFHLKEKRDLTAAYKFYCDKVLQNAHAAEADVLATTEILEAQLNRYDLPKDVDSLHELCNKDQEFIDYARKFVRNNNGDIIFNFGKHRNQKALSEIEYLEWMLTTNFPHHTKLCINRILTGELK
jgi:DNA polymerase III subunit epsilon